jgi:mannosyltransferase
MTQFVKSYLTFAILLAAFALRVYRLDAQSIWWDEGHSIEMASAPLAQIPTLPGMDVHPPGYFAMLHQWMAVAGRSEFALRYLSVVFSLLTVALAMRFARSLPGRSSAAATLAGSLAALAPLYVAYAQEVRMYAMVTFFALTSVYFQWRIIFSPSNTSARGGKFWDLAGYVVTTAASLYTHYFTIFLLLFQNIAWLMWVLKGIRPPLSPPRQNGGEAVPSPIGMGEGQGGGRGVRLVTWLASQAAVALLFLPQLPLALRQTTAYANPNLTPPGAGEFLRRSWLAYTLGAAVDPDTGGQWAVALAGLAGLLTLGLVWKARREPAPLLFLIGWFLVPLAAYYTVLQRRPSFEPRYMMLVTPALYLLLAWGMATFLPARIPFSQRREDSARRGLVSLAAVAVLAVFGLGTWGYFTDSRYFKDDSAGVAAWLAAQATSNDIVYVDVPHPFHYYADRIPAPTRYLFVDVHTAADTLNAEAAGRARVYWVTWRGSDTDPRGIIPFLLDKAGRRTGEQDFRGYHVARWDLAPGAHFSLPTDLAPAAVTFGDVVRLDGAAFGETAPAGGATWATLHFTLLRATDVDYRVSLRLRDAKGAMLPPTDKDLLDDRHFRTSAWPLDDPRLNQAINVYTLPVPPTIPAGDYCLEAVVYAATDLEALPIASDTHRPEAGCASLPNDGTSTRLGSVAVSR